MFAFGIEHPVGPTILAPVLLVAIAIGPIFDDILAITNSTSVDFRFLDHPSILLITYFCATTKIRSKLDTFQGKSKFTTWATKIAANHTISALRRAKWRDLSLDAITGTGTPLREILGTDFATTNTPDVDVERRQVWQTIIKVINNDLGERQRQALTGVHFENMPTTEVAHRLNTNLNNIHKLLHDARLSLKRRLQLLDLEPQYILQLFGTDSGTGYRRPLMVPASSTARW